MGRFVSQKGMYDTRLSEAVANSLAKRARKEGFEVVVRNNTQCSCSASCGAFSSVDYIGKDRERWNLFMEKQREREMSKPKYQKALKEADERIARMQAKVARIKKEESQLL
jgi:hypothetical protein